MKKTSKKPKNAAEFDRYFEDNDIAHLLEAKPVRFNVDLPQPMLARLDSKAKLMGLTRQALVKYWIAEHLKMTQ